MNMTNIGGISMNNRGISLAGSIIADIGYTIEKYPQKGNLTRIFDPLEHTGGLCNVLIDLAKLDEDLPLKVSGVIGDDEKGEFIKHTLELYKNIDITNIVTRGRTATTYVMTEDKTKERTFFFDLGTSYDFNMEDIKFERVESDFFLLEYLLSLGHLDEPHELYGTKAAEVLRKAQMYGMKTIIDMTSEDSDRYKTVVRPALKYVDYYISNEVEASGVTGKKLYDENGIIEGEVLDSLKYIEKLGVKKWIIIHSPSCAFGYDCETKEFVKVPSIHLPEGCVRGTTGAGDAFCAGVVYGAYKGEKIEEAVLIGRDTATCSLLKSDSNGGIVPYKLLGKEIKKIRGVVTR